MNKTLIFGHKNPDTDSITSSIVMADLQTQLGLDVEAVRLGEFGKETQFILDHFQVETPRLIANLDG
ncbi:MAG: DHH family phosphoesterase, partial [Culicoidibacterales bacterium]